MKQIGKREMNSMEKKLPDCPVETTLMLISDRWKVLILSLIHI